MAKPKLSPREIVQRLQTIDALTADGVPVAEAIRSAGVLPAEYDRWRIEYNGLGRTLGPLLCAAAEAHGGEAPRDARPRAQSPEVIPPAYCGVAFRLVQRRRYCRSGAGRAMVAAPAGRLCDRLGWLIAAGGFRIDLRASRLSLRSEPDAGAAETI